MAVVPAWTPGRAAFAGVALGLGAVAALTALIFMGTRRPIGRVLGGGLAILLLAGGLGSTSAATMADPTQARIRDLELSVTCTVSPDMQSVVAKAEFRWQKLDLGPGLNAAPGMDSLQMNAELPEYLLPELGAPQPDFGRPRLVEGRNSAGPYWSAASPPIH